MPNTDLMDRMDVIHHMDGWDSLGDDLYSLDREDYYEAVPERYDPYEDDPILIIDDEDYPRVSKPVGFIIEDDHLYPTEDEVELFDEMVLPMRHSCRPGPRPVFILDEKDGSDSHGRRGRRQYDCHNMGFRGNRRTIRHPW